LEEKMAYNPECVNCGEEIDIEDGDFCVDSKGNYFCCHSCMDGYEEPDDEEYDDTNTEDEDERLFGDSIHIWGEDDVEEALLRNENLTTDGMEQILDECTRFEDQYQNHRIILKEDESSVGIIIEIWEDEDRKVKSELYLYDDIN
jgi:hypothetical protein